MLMDDLKRHANKFYGKYRGIVKDNKDENFQGTIKVVVPSVFGEAVVQAKACMPYGHYYVPPNDSNVWVEFEEGNRDSPIWSGAWLPRGKAPVEAQMSPPEARVIQTTAGHTIRIVDKAGEEQILIRHASDAFISIDSKGSILMSNPKGSHIHLDAENGKATIVEEHGNHLVMTSEGTALVNPSGTTVNVSGDKVHLSAASVVVDATNVSLGMGAMDSTVLGNGFQILWTALQAHFHPSAMGPTGPSPLLAPLMLQPGIHLSSSVVVK